MKTIEVRNQAEYDAAVKAGAEDIRVIGGHVELSGTTFATLLGNASAELWGSSRAELWGSSRAVLWGSSRAVLRGSSRAVLWGSSSAVLWESSSAVLLGSSRAELRESSRAVLWGSSSAELWGSSSAEAAQYCPVTILSKTAKATGGVQIRPDYSTPQKWCDYYGVKVTRGVAVLYKALDENYVSPRGMAYTPGTVPEAPDWDGGKAECGGGLHFSPHPQMTLEFVGNPEHYVACPVALKDMVVHPDGDMPQKCKAQRCCAPIWECDEDGKRIEAKK